MSGPQTLPQEIEPYITAEADLILLHRWNDTREKDGKTQELGKAPLDKGWRKKVYSAGQLRQHIRDNRNLGWRLPANVVVLDVDRRNFPEGRDCLTELVAALGLDLERYPHVITGSCTDPRDGHYYMAKPADVRVRATMPDYPGIELKSLGVQVVIAGSVHPNGKLYRWDDLAPSMVDGLPPCPGRLLSMFRIPSAPPTEGGGELSQERLEELLGCLDAKEFREHDRWLRLMMAAHHATGGMGMDEFLDWSASDPEYANKRNENAKRWDSLHAAGAAQGTVGVGTLYRELKLAGHDEMIPHTEVGEEFDDPPTLEESQSDAAASETGETKKVLSWLHELNRDHWAVDEDGKFVIYHRAFDPDGRLSWTRHGRYDFENLHCNRKIELSGGTEKLGKAWIEWPRRRSAAGVCFEPEREMKGWLNLWQGWAVEPKRGDWSLMQTLMHDVLCGGKEDQYEYLLNWCAHLFQHPGSQGEVAVVLRGPKGMGKGTFGNALCSIAGHHGLPIASPDLLTGRFNGHLKSCVVLFADEAFWAGDKAAESKLKQLITEPYIMYEGKGTNAARGRNLVHVVIASNDKWVIPAGINRERRFFVSDTVPMSNREAEADFFRQLGRQMRNGGLSAMLSDFLSRDLGGRHIREFKIPSSVGLVEQKLRSLSEIGTWWLEMLTAGQIRSVDGKKWSEGPVECFLHDLQSELATFTSDIGSRRSRRSVGIQFGLEFQDIVPSLKSIKAAVPEDRMDVESWEDGRARAYRIPSLKTCREFFATKLLEAPQYQWGDEKDWLG